jgi:pimeloyl-ACP methyl ester carboxylesterase
VAAFYANENFPFPVVEELRRLGHDVMTTKCPAAPERTHGTSHPGQGRAQGPNQDTAKLDATDQTVPPTANAPNIVTFSQTDFTEQLKKFTVPTLVMHGDDDQIVPLC